MVQSSLHRTARFCGWFFLVLLCAGSALGQDAGASQSAVNIRMRDACDPKTFNAVIGPGTCVPGRHGTTKFEFFVGELQEDKIAGAWRFDPLLKASTGKFQLVTVNVNSGSQLMVHNEGGETHTFTRVASFGGGVVPFLNQLSDNPVPAPECLQPNETETNLIVEAGVTDKGPVAGSASLPQGVSRWECCIHPWMRMRINVH
jgi:hypothetical protein